MTFSPRINEAIKLASHLHRHQTRKDLNSTPYASHLFSVAMILSTVTDDEDVIIAGLMHDSLEDVPHFTYDMLVEACGARVAEIVQHVTEPLDANKQDNEQLPWLTRKEQYMENLRNGGKESALVSAADKIHNTESLLHDTEEDGEVFLSRFASSLRNRLWFHEQVLLIVEEKLGKDHVLVSHLRLCTQDFKNLVTSVG
jgi:(p)ppGpp synthase/HD superfamily hydrolase